MYEPRRVRPAPVEPLACMVVLRELGPQLDQLAAGLETSPLAGNQAAGRELRTSLVWMRQTAEDARACLMGSAGGTSEPGVAVDRAVSPAGNVAVRDLRVREVAKQLGVSGSYVTRLCRDEGLLATKHNGRDWAIDAASVAKYKATRRPVA